MTDKEKDVLLLKLKLKKTKDGIFADKVRILGRKETRKLRIERWFQ